MKYLRYTIVITAVLTSITLLLLNSGCGGGKNTHDLGSSFNGRVYGMSTEPIGSETDIETDTWIHVYWPDSNYPPPKNFSVRVEKFVSSDDWDAITTQLVDESSIPENGSWWFKPTSDLSANTWYRVIVTDNMKIQQIFCFRTLGTLSAAMSGVRSAAAASGRYKPQNADSISTSKGAIAEEHHILR